MELATTTFRLQQKAQLVFVVGANTAAFVLLTTGAVSTWRARGPLNHTSIEAPAPQPELDTTALANSGVFGTAPGGGAAAAFSSLTDLSLTLRGVVALKAGGLALLSVNGGKTEPYRIGQEIRDGAVLEELYADRVVVRRGAEFQTVVLAGPRVIKETGAFQERVSGE